MKKKILTLTVSKQWFDKIVACEKTEEYREIKPYWIKRLTANCEVAYDVAAETYCGKVLYRPYTHVLFINGYRKKQRQPAQAWSEDVEDWQMAESASHTAGGLKSAEAVALESLPDSDIKDALAAIPEDFRLAVYFADVEGFSYQEIADIMKTPVGTVMSRLHRGRRLLRDMLADYARDRGIAVAPTTRSTT